MGLHIRIYIVISILSRFMFSVKNVFFCCKYHEKISSHMPMKMKIVILYLAYKTVVRFIGYIELYRYYHNHTLFHFQYLGKLF